MTNHLLVFGPGYTAKPVMEHAQKAGWIVTASYRNSETRIQLTEHGFQAVDANAGKLASEVPVSHILMSIAPTENGDPILNLWSDWLTEQNQINALLYLSSTNVYGDHAGAWVDETTEPKPSLERGIRRLAAERSWQSVAKSQGWRAFVFRLAGIYGPGRNSLLSLQRGKARRIIKPGQVFGRIHRTDIEEAIWLAMTSNHTGGVFNLADDLPCPPQEVIEAAATMLGMAPPAEEIYTEAVMSPMARSFYCDNKQVRNDKIKQELRLDLKYPSYKEGLAALYENLDG